MPIFTAIMFTDIILLSTQNCKSQLEIMKIFIFIIFILKIIFLFQDRKIDMQWQQKFSFDIIVVI